MTQGEALENAMRRALALAARGPAVGVNPQVGCVLLNDVGEIVAEGWHRGVGSAHAEVDALSQVADARGLTAVVTLEPCNHTGTTGPCSHALVAAGISTVYFGVSDPGLRARDGAKHLAASGVSVTGGVLADEVAEFLRPWLTSVRLGRPFVTAKWASSLDGRAAAEDGTSQWITGTTARQRVHEQRAASDAILVGTGTVLADDPSLTARGEAGELLEHQPLPVVVGVRPVPADARLRSHPAGLVETGSRDLPAVLSDLFERGIRRLYVEGGPRLLSAMVAEGLVDDFRVFIAPVLIGGSGLAISDIGVGSIADARKLAITDIEQLGNDLLVSARPIAGEGAVSLRAGALLGQQEAEG